MGEKLCQLVPKEYKEAWLKRDESASQAKDEIMKAIIKAKMSQNSEQDEKIESSNNKNITNSNAQTSAMITQNLQYCFQKWLEENGYKDELERLGNFSNSFGQRV